MPAIRIVAYGVYTREFRLWRADTLPEASARAEFVFGYDVFLTNVGLNIFDLDAVDDSFAPYRMLTLFLMHFCNQIDVELAHWQNVYIPAYATSIGTLLF